MRFPSLARCAVVAALVVATGCSSNLGPSDVAGTYALRAVAGDALPTVVSTGFYTEGPPVVLADTIRLRADGTGTRSRTIMSGTDPYNIGAGVSRAVFDLVVHVDGRRVDLRYACPPNASCVGIGAAHLTTIGLTIDATADARGPQVYQRVAGEP